MTTPSEEERRRRLQRQRETLGLTGPPPSFAAEGDRQRQRAALGLTGPTPQADPQATARETGEGLTPFAARIREQRLAAGLPARPDIPVADPLDALSRFSRTGAGAIFAGAERAGVPGLSEFEERRQAARTQGAGPLEALRLAEERTDFPAARVTAVPFGGIPLPGGRRLEQVDVGVKGLAEFLADPTLTLPGIGFGGLAARGGRLGLRAAARAPGAIAREVSTTPRLRGPLTAPAREAVREAPEVAARAAQPSMTGREAVEALGREEFAHTFGAESRQNVLDNLLRAIQVDNPGQAAPSITWIRRMAGPKGNRQPEWVLSVNTEGFPAQRVAKYGLEPAPDVAIAGPQGRAFRLREAVPEQQALQPPAQPPQPPRGPDVPAGGALTAPRRIDDSLFDELQNAHFDRPEAQDLLRGAAERLEGIRGVGPIVRATNPSAVARTNPALKEGITYRLAEQIQDAQLSTRIAPFARRVPFDVDNQGRVLLQDGRRVAFGDVAENPSQFAVAPEQRQWIDEGWAYIDELADNYEVVSGKKLRSEIVREHYWPRFVRNEQGQFTPGARVGSRQSITRERVLETMEAGLESNVPYVSDPLQQLQLYGRAIQRMTRDEILIKRLKSQGLARELTEGRVTRAEVQASEFAPKGFQTLVFDRETARALKGPLGAGQGFLRPIEMVSAIPRLLVTGVMDTGQFMIQGLTLLAKNPPQWARALGISLRSIAQPRFFSRWVSESDAARRAANYGVDVGTPSEFFQALPLVGRIPGVGQVARGAQRGFESFLGAGRVALFDGMADAAARSGLTGQALEGELHRLGRVADTLMGTPSSKGLGVSATQRQVENAFIAFSPRYTRSVYGTIAHMFGKGVGPQEVRRTVAKMLFGGAASYYGIAKALGMSDEEAIKGLDPRSGKRFMSIRIGRGWFGIGGAYRSMLGFVGALGNKDRWDFDNWDETLLQNPVTRYMRSRASPLTSTLADFIDGEDFIGRPFTLEAFAEDPRNLLDALIQRGAPFPVQGFLEARGSVKERFAAAGAEAGGLRVSPETFTDVADEEAKVLGYVDRYRNLEPYQKDDVELTPNVQRIQEDQRTFGLFKTLQDIDADEDNKVQELLALVKQPRIGKWAKGSGAWKAFVVGRYFDLTSAAFNQKSGARRNAGQTFTSDTQRAEDLDTWYGLNDQAQGVPDTLVKLRDEFQASIGAERRAFVLRNIYLKPVPPVIAALLSDASRKRRGDAETARNRHRVGTGVHAPTRPTQPQGVAPSRRVLPEDAVSIPSGLRSR